MSFKDEDVKFDKEFMKEMYQNIVCAMYEQVLEGEADSKTFKMLLDEVHKFEIDLLDVDGESVISFTNPKTSNTIKIPFGELGR